MITSEIPRLFGADRVYDDAVSPLAENLVILGYRQDDELINRTMTVIKTRASRHDPAIRTFVIGSDGIVLDKPVHSSEAS